MYAHFNVIILGQTTKQNEQIFSNFVWSREKKHQQIKVEKNEFILCIEGAVSLAQMNQQEKIGESVKTLFIASSSSKIYRELKKRNLLYASKQSIFSRMKKAEFKEVEDSENGDNLVAISIRKKKEYQSKPDLRFRRRNFQYRYVS